MKQRIPRKLKKKFKKDAQRYDMHTLFKTNFDNLILYGETVVDWQDVMTVAAGLD